MRTTNTPYGTSNLNFYPSHPTVTSAHPEPLSSVSVAPIPNELNNDANNMYKKKRKDGISSPSKNVAREHDENSFEQSAKISTTIQHQNNRPVGAQNYATISIAGSSHDSFSVVTINDDDISDDEVSTSENVVASTPLQSDKVSKPPELNPIFIISITYIMNIPSL